MLLWPWNLLTVIEQQQSHDHETFLSSSTMKEAKHFEVGSVFCDTAAFSTLICLHPPIYTTEQKASAYREIPRHFLKIILEN